MQLAMMPVLSLARGMWHKHGPELRVLDIYLTANAFHIPA